MLSSFPGALFAYPSVDPQTADARRRAARTAGRVLEDGTVEIVWLVVGLVVGVVAGWFLWARLGATRLDDEFAEKSRHVDAQVTAATSRANDAEAELETARQQLRDSKAEVKDLSKQLEKAKSRSEKLRSQHAETRDALEAAEERVAEIAELRASLEESRAATASLKEKAEAMAARLGEVEEMRARLVSAQDRLVEAERAKETARIRAAEAEEVTERATVELDAAMQSLSKLREAAEENLTLRRQLDGARERMAQLERTVSGQAAEMAELRDQMASASISFPDEQATVAVEAEEIESEAGDGQVATDEPTPSPERSEEERAHSEPDQGVPSEPTEASVDADRQSAVAKVREIATRTAGGQAPADDDLKAIHGVGPKLERLLKEMGITSYLQVANLTPSDVETVTLALDAFPGRIERDDWVASADALYREHYESDE